MIKIGNEDGRLARVQKRYYSFVARRDRIMLDDLKSKDILHPRLTVTKIIGFFVAGLIHSVTIILPIIGLWIILGHLGGYFSVCYGLIFLALAYVVRPRFIPLPKEVLSRTEYPTLYEFVDNISNELNAPLIDAIVVDGQKNATLGSYGWRQAKILTIGYPLWQGLKEQSRSALIGHELAHQINRDSTRGVIVGTALTTLFTWYHLFYPDAIVDPRAGLVGVPVNLFLWTVANIILAIYIGLSQILLYDKRRAEYLADYMGASIGGTQAMIDVIKWLRDSNPRTTIDTVITHPSSDLRIEFLESKPDLLNRVVLQPDYSKRIDDELQPLYKAIEKRALMIRRSGYY
jgi:Zn-dependent protease with chaperone function